MRFCYPKSIRLTKSWQYQYLYQKGKHIAGTYIDLYHLGEHPFGGSPKLFGITVSRKVGKAHKRSKLKRWLRELIRTHQHELEQRAYVFNARSEMAEATWEQLKTDWINVCRQAGCYQS